jgi:hypothetical protein
VGTTSFATFLILLINCTFASHVYSPTVYFIANAIFISPQCSASHRHSLCLSAVLLSFPFFLFDIKIPGKPFQIIIYYNKLFQFTSLSDSHYCCFTCRFAHNRIFFNVSGRYRWQSLGQSGYSRNTFLRY